VLNVVKAILGLAVGVAIASVCSRLLGMQSRNARLIEIRYISPSLSWELAETAELPLISLDTTSLPFGVGGLFPTAS